MYRAPRKSRCLAAERSIVLCDVVAHSHGKVGDATRLRRKVCTNGIVRLNRGLASTDRSDSGHRRGSPECTQIHILLALAHAQHSDLVPSAPDLRWSLWSQWCLLLCLDRACLAAALCRVSRQASSMTHPRQPCLRAAQAAPPRHPLRRGLHPQVQSSRRRLARLASPQARHSPCQARPVRAGVARGLW